MVTVRDYADNVVTNLSGTLTDAHWHYGFDNGQLAAFTRGTSRTAVTLSQASQPAGIGVEVLGALGASRDFATIGPADHLDVTWAPTATATGCSGSLVVRALDGAQNVVTGYTGTPPAIETYNDITLDRDTAEPFVRGVSVTPLTVTGGTFYDQVIVSDPAFQGTCLENAC